MKRNCKIKKEPSFFSFSFAMIYAYLIYVTCITYRLWLKKLENYVIIEIFNYFHELSQQRCWSKIIEKLFERKNYRILNFRRSKKKHAWIKKSAKRIQRLSTAKNILPSGLTSSRAGKFFCFREFVFADVEATRSNGEWSRLIFFGM